MGAENSSPEPQNGKVVRFLNNDNRSNVDHEKLEQMRQEHESHFNVDENTTNEDFYNYRNSSNVEAAMKYLHDLGSCVNHIEPDDTQEYCQNGVNEKILFIVCNNYKRPDYQLGVGPIDDALTVAIHHKKMGYNIIFLHNSTPHHFKKWLKHILQNTLSDLTIFYTGHGSQIRDVSGDESDGYDEVMIFDDGYIVDDDLGDYLHKYAHGQRIVLLTDCCHSGSIWDIQSLKAEHENVAPNIISIAAATDAETSKQTKLGQKDHGIFTYFFWNTFNENPMISTVEMKNKIDPILSRFRQMLDFCGTSDGIENEPIFPDQ
ncbi:hypothetical protein M9Y10_030539 [Tritrichomonas musculus]|uniref:Peptidase C14 caspase domain-containing protein n=1 Tax=Tritrichomonas musculus TaxID=1915356 RepID=A0ABR2H3M3_9EUKA